MAFAPPPTATFTDSPGSTSSSLLHRLKAHDADAWARLVEWYGPLVYQWCRRSVQAADAADVVQEVFTAVARHVGDFRRDRPGDSFRGWLWTITRNKLRDHFRRLAGQPQGEGGTAAQQQWAQLPDEPPEASPDAGSAAAANLGYRALELVRAGVEPHTWQAFWRTTVEGAAAADVAQELGVSVQAVYDAKYRVRRQIRRELGELLD